MCRTNYKFCFSASFFSSFFASSRVFMRSYSSMCLHASLFETLITDCGEEMPMCVFIPEVAQSLSLYLHVTCTGILKRAQYHCLIKESLTCMNHPHDFRQRKGEVYFWDNKCNFFLCNCCYAPQGVRSRSLWGFISLCSVLENVYSHFWGRSDIMKTSVRRSHKLE